MSENDGFDQFRDLLGADKVDTLMATLGMGPKYKPEPPRLYDCPKCGGHNCRIIEQHPDTDMNCMALVCPDCHYEEEH